MEKESELLLNTFSQNIWSALKQKLMSAKSFTRSYRKLLKF